MCMYMCACMWIVMCMCTCAYLYECTCVCLYICVCMCIYVCVCLFLCVYGHVRVRVHVCVCLPICHFWCMEVWGKLAEVPPSFHHVSLGDRTQVIILGSKCLYQLSYLAPTWCLYFQCRFYDNRLNGGFLFFFWFWETMGFKYAA